MFISSEGWSQIPPKLNEHNYKGTVFWGYCIDGVEYLQIGINQSRTIFPRLKPDGKPVTCNY